MKNKYPVEVHLVYTVEKEGSRLVVHGGEEYLSKGGKFVNMMDYDLKAIAKAIIKFLERAKR